MTPDRAARPPRLPAFALALALLAPGAPARAGDPVHPETTTPRADPRPGLLFLSFLVPLPIPLALVASPSVSRQPAPREDPPARREPAPPPPVRQAARQAR